MTSEGKKENQKQEKESSPDQAKKETSLNQQKIPMVAFIPIVWAIIAMVITTFRSGYIQGFVEAVRTPEANGYCRFDPATNAHACEQRTSALFAPNGDSENATLLEIAADIDAMILAACKAVGVENPEIACAPHSGARLIDSRGTRVRKVAELIHGRARASYLCRTEVAAFHLANSKSKWGTLSPPPTSNLPILKTRYVVIPLLLSLIASPLLLRSSRLLLQKDDNDVELETASLQN
eukprot:jgi/Bigna1/137424/aug1.39_g12132